MSEPQPDRLYEIDLLRFIAAVAVVLYHYSFHGDVAHAIPVAHWPALNGVSRYGYLGVELFFMISGFVILLSAHNRSPGAFVRSRVTRLYPAYWLCLTLTALVLLAWGIGRFVVTPGQYLINLTMLQKFLAVRHVDGVYWTLVVEMKFYFLVWLLLRTGTMPKIRTWLWLWLAITVAALVAPEAVSDRLESLALAKWAPFFSVGVACYLLRDERTSPLNDWLLLFAAGVLATTIASKDAIKLSHSLQQAISPIVVASIVGVFTVVFAALALNWSRVLRLPVLSHFGALTYPLYLLHAYIGYTLMRTFGGNESAPLFVFCLIVLMIAFSWLLSQFVERPLANQLRLLLKNKFAG